MPGAVSLDLSGGKQGFRVVDRGKVRVISSVLAGYQFLFGRLPRLVHVAWFPGVLFVIAGIIANEYMRQIDIINMPNGEVKGALIRLLEIMTAYSLFQLAMTLVVIVGFYRVALQEFRPRGPLYFRFRNDELRTAGIWFLVVVALYALFMTLVYTLIIVVAGYIGISSNSAGSGVALVELMSVNSNALLWVWLGLSMLLMYWVYSRFFLAIPAALEHRVTTLGEVWAVTRGNGFRLACYVLFLVISLIVFALALFYLIEIAQMVAASILVTILSPEAISAVEQRSQDMEGLIGNLPAWGRYLVAGLAQIGVFFAYIFSWAIVIGSASSAFRDIWPAESD